MRLLAAVLLALLLTTAGCGSDDGSQGGDQAGDQGGEGKSSGSSGTSKDDSSDDAGSDEPALTKDDVSLQLKVTQKNCFDGSGCFVDFQIVPTLKSAGDGLDQDYIVGYEVTGGEDGPGRNNVLLHQDGQFDKTDPGTVQTKSKDVALQVRVSSVDPKPE